MGSAATAAGVTACASCVADVFGTVAGTATAGGATERPAVSRCGGGGREETMLNKGILSTEGRVRMTALRVVRTLPAATAETREEIWSERLR